MKSLLLTAALAAFTMQAQAQTPTTPAPRAAADQIATKKGPLTVQPITHGSVVLT